MNTLSVCVSLANSAAVSIFGSLLSASFCGVLDTRKNRRTFWLGVALLLIAQGAAYFLLGEWGWRRLYPFLVHFPLLFLIRAITGRWLWPTISILFAYLFCQMRRWPALLVMALLPEMELAQPLTELAVTLPLLFLLLRFAAPAVRQLMDYPVKTQCQFGLVPALYCAFDYFTLANPSLLSGNFPVVVEFMPTACCGAYLIFLLYNFSEERKRRLLQQLQDNLKLQVAQAAREIRDLQESQAQASRYRHDLRHHLQYLLSCIENGQTERAKGYISGICTELESQQVRRYCENEAVNLILSAFVKRTEGTGVEMEIRGALPAVLSVSDNDLCVILSNALENALHACLPLAGAGRECVIRVEFRLHEQNGRLFLQIVNPYQGEVRFENELPVSDRPGHGVGAQSIRAVVERYGGGCSFLAERGQFILRLFL